MVPACATVPVPTLATVGRTSPPNAAVVNFLGDAWPNHTAGLDYSCRRDLDSGVIRFEIRSGDRAYFDASTRDRSELSGGLMPYDFDRDIWQQYWLWIEPGSSAGANAGQQPIFGQWHDLGDGDDAGGMPPPVAIIWTGTKLRWQWAYSMADPYDGTFTAGSIDMGTVIPGRWVNIVQRLKFAAAVVGSEADVWMDGVKYVTYRDRLSTPNDQGCYPKFGIYRNTAPDPCAVRYIWRKPGYETLAALIAAPPPFWRA